LNTAKPTRQVHHNQSAAGSDATNYLILHGDEQKPHLLIRKPETEAKIGGETAAAAANETKSLPRRDHPKPETVTPGNDFINIRFG
jgi:hypothetical protein